VTKSSCRPPKVISLRSRINFYGLCDCRTLHRRQRHRLCGRCPVDCIHPKKDGPGSARRRSLYRSGRMYLLRHLRSGLSGIGRSMRKKDLPPGWSILLRSCWAVCEAEVTIAPKPPAVRWLKKRVVGSFAGVARQACMSGRFDQPVSCHCHSPLSFSLTSARLFELGSTSRYSHKRPLPQEFFGASHRRRPD